MVAPHRSPRATIGSQGIPALPRVSPHGWAPLGKRHMRGIRMYKKLDKVLARRVRLALRFTNCAQCQHSYRRNIDRDAVCHPVGHALRDEWATVPDSCVLRVLPIVRLLIQGSCGPVGNAGEPLLFTVVACCGGAAQPCLSYPPPDFSAF